VKKKFLLLLLVITLCIAMVSCRTGGLNNQNINYQAGTLIHKNNDDIMDKGPVKGGTLNLYITEPDTLNPIITGNANIRDMSDLIFEPLIKLDKTQKPVPALAKKWDVSSDGLTWTFYMREGVNWHDGIPFTAEDVEFTFSTILNHNLNSIYKSKLQNITTFAAIDRNTFRIILKRPNSFTPELMTFPIIAKHSFAGENIINASANMSPNGTGPFKFRSYNKNSTIKLVANDKWWNSDNPDKRYPNLPYLAEIDVKIFNNTKDAINAFQTGDIDVTSVAIGESGKYQGRSDLILKRFIGSKFDFIAFNNTKPSLSDKTVRQAIAYAIDRHKIINDLIPGEAVVSDLPIIPGSWLNESSSTGYSFNKEKLRGILTQNNWKQDHEGYWYKYINGLYTPLSFELLVNQDNQIRLKVAQKIMEQLGLMGFKINIKKAAGEELIRLVNSRRYDMAILGCTVSNPMDISYLYASSSSQHIGSDVLIPNISAYSNPVVDNYFYEIAKEAELTKRNKLFSSMRDVINNDVPYLGLYFYNESTLYNKRLRGDISPYLWNKSNNITKWYLPLR
jgi:peptide/nickel transport system substrate-binding protein